jgi:thymidine kinase
LGETQEYEPLSRAAYFKANLKEVLQDFDVDAENLSMQHEEE